MSGSEKSDDEKEMEMEVSVSNASGQKEVGQMHKGDYMIHVFIEETRALKLADEDTVDPIIEVACLGKRQFTKEKDDIGVGASVSWNEHIFYEPKNLSQADIESGKIQIRVLDKRIFKDSVIGIHNFDIPQIYFKDKHALFHQWVALSNPTSLKYNEISGYLKLSISVIGSGDEQVALNEDSTIDKTESTFIVVPPYIQTKYYQLKFRIFTGECLPELDNWGTIDAYIQCSYMNKKLKTKVYTQKNNKVIWNQEIWLPAQMPILSSRLIFKVYDKDKMSKELVASMKFNIEDYIKMAENNEEFPFFWKIFMEHLFMCQESIQIL